MEKKKNEKYDLERKSPLFFSIGLITALMLVTVAFEWRSEYDPLDVFEPKQDLFDDPIVIPITQHEQPEPPKPIMEPKIKKPEIVGPTDLANITEAPDELTVVKKTIDNDAFDIPDDILTDAPVEKVPTKFIKVEKMPEFPGGINEFRKYIGENIRYTSEARKNGFKGKILISFVIDEKGRITNLEMSPKPGSRMDEAIARVLKNAPRWEPGKQRGRPVKFRMSIPIAFDLTTF